MKVQWPFYLSYKMSAFNPSMVFLLKITHQSIFVFFLFPEHCDKQSTAICSDVPPRWPQPLGTHRPFLTRCDESHFSYFNALSSSYFMLKLLPTSWKVVILPEICRCFVIPFKKDGSKCDIKGNLVFKNWLAQKSLK